MKQTIKLTENDLNKIIKESINEINRERQGRIARILGTGPSFDATNVRHKEAYNNIRNSVFNEMNRFHLRPNVMSEMLRSIEDDIDLEQF